MVISGKIPAGCGKSMKANGATKDFYYVRCSSYGNRQYGEIEELKYDGKYYEGRSQTCGHSAPNPDWIAICTPCLRKTGALW